ncbi:universal stress protein [Paractinoplanes durhamensis]|uniref:Universal stress protein UspA n=1 Tax=Paractinoplanes durhamensis TaxID=113563 RepID=A0ABQ3YRM1_9ACTN|nr:universal stress protein [Actinoplanes durhamensis]GIE00226.1 universal stress protein UspA [Actinoplanes durhamensis]
MSHLEKSRTQREARRDHADRDHAARYSEAVGRFLGVAGHRSEEPARPTFAAATPAAVTAVTAVGVVLAAVDDSPAGYTTADHAALEAELRGWGLLLVHVQRTGGVRTPARDDGARLLDRLTERVQAYSPTVAVTSRLLVGWAAPLLLAEARDAGLVVVGHRHGAAGAMFGVSVGDRVAAAHTGVVLVVRVPGRPAGPGFSPRPIVVGADRDDSPAVRFARREAELRGTDLVILRAGTTPRAERVETAGRIRVYRRFVVEEPGPALIAASTEAAALVVGRHGPGRTPAGPIGSVTRSVVQHAQGPVFLVG